MNIPLASLNTVSAYNKVFDQNLKQFNEDLSKSENQFGTILEQKMSAQPQTFAGGISLNVGAENMGVMPMEESAGIKNVHASSPVEKTANNFGQAFENGLNSLNNQQAEAERAAEIMASGGDISAHEVMIAAEKANLSMQMAIQIRNKIVAAYNEVNNIRV